MSTLSLFMVYKPLKDTLKCQMGTRKAYSTLVGLLGRGRAYHQTRGCVGINVHIPGHTAPMGCACAVRLCAVSSEIPGKDRYVML